MSQSSPNAMSQAERIARVAELNDALRRSIHSPGRNQIVMTAGVAALIGEVALFRGFRRRAEIIRIVRDYDSFTPDNDPIDEHDFGRFEFEDAILDFARFGAVEEPAFEADGGALQAFGGGDGDFLAHVLGGDASFVDLLGDA